jgi:hypothetical protein
MTKRQYSDDGYDREYLEALIEEATVDCYDEYEQATGLFTMIEDELDLPFTMHIFIDFGQLCSSKPTGRVHGNRTPVFMISATRFQPGQHT